MIQPRTDGAEEIRPPASKTSWVAIFEVAFVPDKGDLLGDNLCVEERAHVRAAVEGLVLALLLFWSVPIKE